MKICIVLIASLIAVIRAENCFETSDCNHLTCGTGHFILCAKPSDSDVHICTCATNSTGTCTTQADCQRNVCQSQRDPHEHCVDGHCRCLQRN